MGESSKVNILTEGADNLLIELVGMYTKCEDIIRAKEGNLEVEDLEGVMEDYLIPYDTLEKLVGLADILTRDIQHLSALYQVWVEDTEGRTFTQVVKCYKGLILPEDALGPTLHVFLLQTIKEKADKLTHYMHLN